MEHAPQGPGGTGIKVRDKDGPDISSAPRNRVGVDGGFGTPWLSLVVRRGRKWRAGRLNRAMGNECVAGWESDVDSILEHVLEHVEIKKVKPFVRFRGSSRDRAVLKETLDAAFNEPSYLGGEGSVLLHEPAERGLEGARGQEGR